MSGAWRGNAVRVSYINGIRTGEAECREHAERIGALFASPCYAFWNKTAGALSDLSQAALQKVFSADTEGVRQLAQHLSTHLEAVGSDGLLVHIAHSQGALITSLCRRHLTIAQRARIHVIVLGGAESISDREFGSAVNYYCTNEPMLYIDKRASRAWRQLESRSAQPRVSDAGSLASAANAKNQPRKSTDKNAHTQAADREKQTEAAHRQATLGATTPGLWQRLVGTGRGTASSSDERAKMLQGALSVDFEGARFTFLRPVHRDRFGIEDHLITNEAYMQALRFEADEFRQRYLWFWQRLRWNYLEPPSSRVPTSPAPGAASSPAPGVKRRGGNNTGTLSGNALLPPSVASKESLRADGGGNAGGSGVVAGVVASNETVQGMQGKACEEGVMSNSDIFPLTSLLGALWTRRVFPRMGSRANSPAVDSPASSLHDPSAPPADARQPVGVMKEKSDRERGASVVMEGVNDKTEGASTQQAGGKSWFDRLRGMRNAPSDIRDMELHDAPASEALTQDSPSAQSAPGPTPASPESVAKSGGKPSLRPDGSTSWCDAVPSALRAAAESGGACPPPPAAGPPATAASHAAKTPEARFTLPRSRL